jgi:hypothetical protein
MGMWNGATKLTDKLSSSLILALKSLQEYRKSMCDARHQRLHKDSKFANVSHCELSNFKPKIDISERLLQP